MNIRKYLILGALGLAFLSGLQAKADEGMWMINAIDAALEKKMKERGLNLSAREIYNADAPGAGVADAVVSMAFGCTGSMISDQGLLITNHHCAYSDVHGLSTPEHNYLEEGFWAFRSEDEVNIAGKSVYFLKRVLDVTDEVLKLQADLIAEGKPSGSRRLSHLIETKYKKETGLDAWLSSMWRGSRYYLALYEVYNDVRLVAAPPVSSAAFGGDIDNWEWPQHKCDFALYRVYTAPDGSPAEYSKDNVPMKPVRKLSISLDGYQEGDYTMIIGYPGSTNRYSSSFETDFTETLKHPVNNAIRGRQMDIIKGWMDKDSDIRLKYSDYFFSLSNMQECFSGEQECFERFDVVEQKEDIEKDLQEWILASPERTEKWGVLLDALKKGYNSIREIERHQSYYRETMIRGSQLALIMRRAHNPRNQAGQGEKMLEKYAELDLRVERDLLEYAVDVFVKNLDTVYMSPWHMELIESFSKDGICDTKALADALWESSIFTSEEGIARLGRWEVPNEELVADSLCRFVMEIKSTDFTEAKASAEGTPNLTALNREYTQALYQMRLEKGIVQYPDANSTMRITYGRVGGFEPRDGVVCDWKTTPAGILEKFNPADYDFYLNDRQYLLYSARQWGKWGFGPDGSQMYVNFLTDNDITGGNSGSPVLNSKGELIGLAFDGNKESLASDAMWTEGYNKCVCVDIRFILWTLDRYAGMTRIIDELGF